MKRLLLRTFGLAASIAALALLLGRYDVVGAQNVFPTYSNSLASSVLIQDATNPTGAYFSPSLLWGQQGGVNAQTGTTYTFAASDAGKLVTFNNSGSVAVTLPVATTAGFTAGRVFSATNLGTGTVTITPTTSTIGGASSLALGTNRGTFIVSDGTNYQLESGTAHLSQTALQVNEGGTGAVTLTNHGVLLGAGTAAVSGLTVGTTGQLLQGATGANPAWATTLSGSYVFSNALIQAGATAGTPTHIATGQTTAPALTSCGGGSPAITGTDTAGIVTMGTTATACTITFNVAYTGTPFCVVSWIATPLASQSYVTSNAAITLTQTSTSGNKVQYICMAQAGG